MREIRENLGYGLEKVAWTSDCATYRKQLRLAISMSCPEMPMSLFLRVYSDYLGLDGQDVVHQFKMADTDITNRTELHLPSPLEDGRIPTVLILGSELLWLLVLSSDGITYRLQKVIRANRNQLPDEFSRRVTAQWRRMRSRRPQRI